MRHKRKKPKQSVRCTMCTHWRWMGNHKGRFDAKTRRALQVTKEEE
jgi:hypothetical protein